MLKIWEDVLQVRYNGGDDGDDDGGDDNSGGCDGGVDGNDADNGDSDCGNTVTVIARM